MTLKSASLVLATAVLGLSTSLAMAQTAAQHNGPGGPKQKVENFVGKLGLTLPPPPPAPSPSVSTTTVTSPPAAPPRKN